MITEQFYVHGQIIRTSISLKQDARVDLRIIGRNVIAYRSSHDIVSELKSTDQMQFTNDFVTEATNSRSKARYLVMKFASVKHVTTVLLSHD